MFPEYIVINGQKIYVNWAVIGSAEMPSGEEDENGEEIEVEVNVYAPVLPPEFYTPQMAIEAYAQYLYAFDGYNAPEKLTTDDRVTAETDGLLDSNLYVQVASYYSVLSYALTKGITQQDIANNQSLNKIISDTAWNMANGLGEFTETDYSQASLTNPQKYSGKVAGGDLDKALAQITEVKATVPTLQSLGLGEFINDPMWYAEIEKIKQFLARWSEEVASEQSSPELIAQHQRTLVGLLTNINLQTAQNYNQTLIKQPDITNPQETTTYTAKNGAITVDDYAQMFGNLSANPTNNGYTGPTSYGWTQFASDPNNQAAVQEAINVAQAEANAALANWDPTQGDKDVLYQDVFASSLGKQLPQTQASDPQYQGIRRYTPQQEAERKAKEDEWKRLTERAHKATMTKQAAVRL